MFKIKAITILIIVLVISTNNTAQAQLSYAEGGPSVEDPGLEVDVELRRYVDATNGSDSNDGKSQAKAWQTLGKVSSSRSSFGPGFHILLKRGETWSGGLDFQKHSGGEEGKRIVLGAYGDLNKNRPKISGFVTLKNYFMARDLEAKKFMFINGHHSIIYNNVCHGSPSNAIAAIGECHHTVIMSNLIYDTALNDCITMHSADWFGDGKSYWVQSHHWIVDNICIGRDGTEDGIDFAMGNYTRDGLPMEGDIKVIANRIQMTAVPGLSSSTGQGVHGIVLSYDGQYHWVVGNTIRGGRGMGIVVRELQKDVQIRGNIVFRGDETSAIGLLATSIDFEFNTVYDYHGLAIPIIMETDNLSFTKNIILRPEGGYWVQKMITPTEMDYNWWGHSTSPNLNGITFSEWQTTTGFDLNSSTGVVAGITEPPVDAYNHDPRNWKDQAFLNQFIPSSEFVGLEGTVPGAYNKESKRQGMKILPFENSYLDNGGLGWEGPPLVQQKLKELGISWGEPLLAKYPSPKDKAIGININGELNWTAGDSSISRDIYIGVKADSLTLVGNQSETTLTLSNLNYETIYYWRVDEVTSNGKQLGVVWSFTTEEEPIPPTLAVQPNPIEQAVDMRTSLRLSWQAGKRTRSSQVYFGKTNPPISVSNIQTNSFNSGILDLNTKYYWRVDGVNEWGVTEGIVWSFTTESVASLPEGWVSLDIGNVNKVGEDSFENNNFTLKSSGTGLNGNADQFRFMYKELSGDGEIIARVSIENASSKAIGGVMIREKIDSTSSYMLSGQTSTSGVKSQWRSFNGGGTKIKNGNTNSSSPHWVKVVRVSDFLVSSESIDGKAWKTLKTEKIKMQNSVQLGLFVTSGDNDSLCTAVFDNVSINGVLVSVEEEIESDGIILKEFTIGNFPNPFNPTTTINYSLPKKGKVTIKIYDIMGSLVKDLVSGKKNAGMYNVIWDGKNSNGLQVSSGVYFYKIQLDEQIKTAKMLLMK